MDVSLLSDLRNCRLLSNFFVFFFGNSSLSDELNELIFSLSYEYNRKKIKRLTKKIELIYEYLHSFRISKKLV
jgi:hypothetical protein